MPDKTFVNINLTRTSGGNVNYDSCLSGTKVDVCDTNSKYWNKVFTLGLVGKVDAWVKRKFVKMQWKQT